MRRSNAPMSPRPYALMLVKSAIFLTYTSQWMEPVKYFATGRWGSGQHMLTRVCNSGLTSEMQQPTLEPRGPAQSALYDDTACNTWRGI
ncbi:unnamed protein product [Plutella xylostella]|uniref:(diamondback moth) hypothetical protein n=1 Tax=Plutella xylostella TaxID=51655 RepID=A0A8S4F8M3_PLUXY|nr:unnamed protein product [Plutella xylostella]